MTTRPSIRVAVRLYLRQTPDSQAEFLRLYDQPIPNDCYIRTESIIPQQALASANSTFFQEASRLLAKSLNGKMPRTRISFAPPSVRFLGAPPITSELAESRKFLASQSALLAEPERSDAILRCGRCTRTSSG